MDAAYSLDLFTVSGSVAVGNVAVTDPAIWADTGLGYGRIQITSTGIVAHGAALVTTEWGWTGDDSLVLDASGEFNSGGALRSGSMSLDLLSIDANVISEEATTIFSEITLTGDLASGGLSETDPYLGLGLPALDWSAALATGGVGVGEFDLDLFGLEASVGATGGSLLLFDSLGVDATLAQGGIARLSASLPAFTLGGALGDLDAATLRSADMALSLPGLLASGIVGGAAAAAFALNPLSLAGTVHAGNAASAEFTLPILGLTVAAYTETVVTSGTITLPMLDLSGQIGDTDLARIADGDALVVNIKTAGVTRYESFGFNSFAIFDGRQIAATSVALYALGGNDDDGTPIQMVLTTPVSDLGQQRIKRVRQAFIGYRSGGAAELHVRADEGDWYIYRLDETRVSGIYRNRVKVGRGTKGAYWQFSVRNVDGADLTLDAIEPIVEVVTTRAS